MNRVEQVEVLARRSECTQPSAAIGLTAVERSGVKFEWIGVGATPPRPFALEYQVARLVGD
jgi:hypothetical protein